MAAVEVSRVFPAEKVRTRLSWANRLFNAHIVAVPLTEASYRRCPSRCGLVVPLGRVALALLRLGHGRKITDSSSSASINKRTTIS